MPAALPRLRLLISGYSFARGRGAHASPSSHGSSRRSLCRSASPREVQSVTRVLDLPYQVFLLAIAGGAIAATRSKRLAIGSAVAWSFAAGAVTAVVLARDPFHAMRHLAWLVFAHAPLWSFVLCVVLWPKQRVVALSMAFAGLSLLGIAADAFLVEPHALEVTHYNIASTKVHTPLRIVLMADIQTDHVGDYERDVFESAAAEKPDLVLLAGDYLQLSGQSFDEERERFQALLRLLKPRLGIWAVEGNVEPHDWQRLFERTDVRVFRATQSEQIEEGVAITGLTLDDAFDIKLEVDPQDPDFHVVVGHAPDFSLGTINGDLLVAGHTHGGQVRLPGIGPLLTLSRVPRPWASGLTTLPGNRTLIVSRGIGMERGYAPRLRFLCPPELVVIDVFPRTR